METLKVNDYVKIKENAFENEPLIGNYKDFQGKITEVSEYEGQAIYSVAFDAQSLMNLPEEFIIDALSSLEEYSIYNFYSTDLEKTQRRDTDEQYEEAMVKIHALEQSYWDGEEEFDDEEFDEEDLEDYEFEDDEDFNVEEFDEDEDDEEEDDDDEDYDDDDEDDDEDYEDDDEE